MICLGKYDFIIKLCNYGIDCIIMQYIATNKINRTNNYQYQNKQEKDYLY